MPKKSPVFGGADIQPAPNDRLPVSAEDYAKAVPGDQFQCALVWAIRRRYPNAMRIRANSGEISFSIGDVRRHYPTDESTVTEVIRPLDEGGELKPTTVRLHDGYTTPVNYLDEEQLAKKRADVATRVSRARRSHPGSEASKSGFRRFRNRSANADDE